ncbi:hypothetical protein [Pseudomonas sp. PLMAX]|uniref:hypothetical protein n=1 Tax=Pseudomonas sp. PLMAX TaxID=2201998 RepID=UPI0038BBE443
MGSTLIEVMAAVMLMALITFGALTFYVSASDQARMIENGKEGSATRQEATSIDKTAPRHSSSGSISNLESF